MNEFDITYFQEKIIKIESKIGSSNDIRSMKKQLAELKRASNDLFQKLNIMKDHLNNKNTSLRSLLNSDSESKKEIFELIFNSIKELKGERIEIMRHGDIQAYNSAAINVPTKQSTIEHKELLSKEFNNFREEFDDFRIELKQFVQESNHETNKVIEDIVSNGFTPHTLMSGRLNQNSKTKNDKSTSNLGNTDSGSTLDHKELNRFLAQIKLLKNQIKNVNNNQINQFKEMEKRMTFSAQQVEEMIVKSHNIYQEKQQQLRDEADSFSSYDSDGGEVSKHTNHKNITTLIKKTQKLSNQMTLAHTKIAEMNLMSSFDYTGPKEMKEAQDQQNSARYSRNRSNKSKQKGRRNRADDHSLPKSPKFLEFPTLKVNSRKRRKSSSNTGKSSTGNNLLRPKRMIREGPFHSHSATKQFGRQNSMVNWYPKEKIKAEDLLQIKVFRSIVRNELNLLRNFYNEFINEEAFHQLNILTSKNRSSLEKMDSIDWYLRNIEFISPMITNNFLSKCTQIYSETKDMRGSFFFSEHKSDIMKSLIKLLKETIHPQALSSVKNVMPKYLEILKITFYSNCNIRKAIDLDYSNTLMSIILQIDNQGDKTSIIALKGLLKLCEHESIILAMIQNIEFMVWLSSILSRLEKNSQYLTGFMSIFNLIEILFYDLNKAKALIQYNDNLPRDLFLNLRFTYSNKRVLEAHLKVRHFFFLGLTWQVLNRFSDFDDMIGTLNSPEYIKMLIGTASNTNHQR